jgi:exoribonuclease R
LTDKTKPTIEDMSADASRVIRNWNNIVGKYVYFDEEISLTHDLLDEKSYVHISSPIRRLVDLLNQIELMQVLNMSVSDDAYIFHKNWINNLDGLNTAMRAIRKIQQECELLHRCNIDPTLLDKEYNGIVFDKVQKTDGMYAYIVYIEELKLLARYGDTEEYPNYGKHKFKLFMFEKESTFKKKIKLQLTE